MKETKYYAVFTDSDGDYVFDGVQQKECHITGVVVTPENMGNYKEADKERGEKNVHNFCYQKQIVWKQIGGTALTVLIWVADAFVTAETAGTAAVVALTLTEGALAWLTHEKLAAWPG